MEKGEVTQHRTVRSKAMPKMFSGRFVGNDLNKGQKLGIHLEGY